MASIACACGEIFELSEDHLRTPVICPGCKAKVDFLLRHDCGKQYKLKNSLYFSPFACPQCQQTVDMDFRPARCEQCGHEMDAATRALKAAKFACPVCDAKLTVGKTPISGYIRIQDPETLRSRKREWFQKLEAEEALRQERAAEAADPVDTTPPLGLPAHRAADAGKMVGNFLLRNARGFVHANKATETAGNSVDHWRGPAAFDAKTASNAARTLARYMHVANWLFLIIRALFIIVMLCSGFYDAYCAHRVRRTKAAAERAHANKEQAKQAWDKASREWGNYQARLTPIETRLTTAKNRVAYFEAVRRGDKNADSLPGAALGYGPRPQTPEAARRALPDLKREQTMAERDLKEAQRPDADTLKNAADNTEKDYEKAEKAAEAANKNASVQHERGALFRMLSIESPSAIFTVTLLAAIIDALIALGIFIFVRATILWFHHSTRLLAHCGEGLAAMRQQAGDSTKGDDSGGR